MKTSKIRILCECAILLAISVVLSYLRFGRSWLVFGGSVTPASMLPVMFISVKYGMRWGFLTSFCFSWFQMLQDGFFGFGLTPAMLAASLLLDYVLAFTVIGIAGIFRRHGFWGILSGVALACALRFLTHFLSGIVLWAQLEQFVAFGKEWVNHPVLYSLCYNGSFMLPETILTVAVAAVLLRLPQVKRLLSQNPT